MLMSGKVLFYDAATVSGTNVNSEMVNGLKEKHQCQVTH